MILKPNNLEPEIDQNVILKFSLIISLVYNKDTDIEAPLPASVSHHCLVLSCLNNGEWISDTSRLIGRT